MACLANRPNLATYLAMAKSGKKTKSPWSLGEMYSVQKQKGSRQEIISEVVRCDSWSLTFPLATSEARRAHQLPLTVVFLWVYLSFGSSTEFLQCSMDAHNSTKSFTRIDRELGQ